MNAKRFIKSGIGWGDIVARLLVYFPGEEWELEEMPGTDIVRDRSGMLWAVCREETVEEMQLGKDLEEAIQTLVRDYTSAGLNVLITTADYEVIREVEA